jgi:hypothetical protein
MFFLEKRTTKKLKYNRRETQVAPHPIPFEFYGIDCGENNEYLPGNF